MRAAAALQASELRVLITVSPLLPISEPRGFFERIAQVADGVVIDHFIRGDGTPDGSRTKATKLPAAMARFDPQTTDDKYLERMVRVAQEVMPGRVGSQRGRVRRAVPARWGNAGVRARSQSGGSAWVCRLQ